MILKTQNLSFKKLFYFSWSSFMRKVFETINKLSTYFFFYYKDSFKAKFCEEKEQQTKNTQYTKD